ncbi:MAG: hypothetical protein CM15mV80_130 [uncultured marine virus]|nr:MAG: hypothetical protein CM15mV80_130 [uncultured marine virus]
MLISLVILLLSYLQDRVLRSIFTVKWIRGTTWAAASGGVTSDAQENTVAGTNAGDSFSGTDAVKNTLFGYDAGTAITTGDNNTFFGHSAGKAVNTAEGIPASGMKLEKL